MNKKTSFHLLALSISLVWGHPVWAAADPATLTDLNNQAVRALNAGDFQLAISKLEEAVRLSPNYKMGRSNLAIAYNNYGLKFAGQPNEAIKYFHKAVLLDPNNATSIGNLNGIIQKMGRNPKDFATRVALGDVCRKTPDFVGAIVEYREALKLRDDAVVHQKLGDVYRVRDENDSAINEYNAAAQTQNSAGLQVSLGQAYLAKKDIASAIGAFGKAIGMKSDDPEVQDGLVSGWEQAVKDNPTAPENHIGLGQAYQYKGDFGQAEAEFKMAITLSPGRRNPQAEKLMQGIGAARQASVIANYINMGVDLQSRKQYQAAIDAYKRALSNNPSDPKQKSDIIMNMGTAYQAMEDYANALACYQQALQFDPSNQAAITGIKTSQAAQKDKAFTDMSKQANDLFKAGQYQAAIAKYLELSKSDPNDGGLHFNIGAAYQLMKDLNNAMVEYNMAIQLDPKNKSYQDALVKLKDLKAQPIIDSALAKHKNKDYLGAIEGYKQALDIVPNQDELWYNLASAQYAVQLFPESRKSYTRVIELDPQGHLDCYYFIATIDENAGNGNQAASEYRSYLEKAGSQAVYAAAARARAQALAQNPSQTQKIKSEAEIAKEKEGLDAYSKAVSLQQSAQYEQADGFYQKALSIDGSNADYIYGRGTNYQQWGKIDEALALYQQASSIVPGNKDFQKAIRDAKILKTGPIVKDAYDKQTAGDLVGAIARYLEAVALDGDNGSIWMNLGVAYQGHDEFPKAYDAYAKAYQLAPKDCVDCLYFLAQIDENFGRGQMALNRYMEYIQRAPSGTYVDQCRKRGMALRTNIAATERMTTSADAKTAQDAARAYEDGVKAQQATDYDTAIGLYQKAMGLQSKEPAYPYALGTCYQTKGDLDSAVKYYQLALGLAPANQQATYKQALEAAKVAQVQPVMDEAVKKHGAGDLDGAIVLYEKALAMYPNNPHGYTNLAGAYQGKDNFNAARRNYQKAIELDPKNESDNYYFIGLIDENNSQVPQAIADYTKYAQLKPSGTYAADAKARAGRLRANPNSAQKLATQAQVQASTQASGAFNEAVTLQQAQKYDEALAKYKEAIQAQPNEASYYYSQGTCYQAKQDFDNALVSYEKAASLNPKEPAYKQLVKQIKQAKASPLVNSAIDKQTNKNDLPGAIADYEAALRICDDATTHSYLGTAYQAQNNLNKAFSEYNRALQLDSSVAMVDTYYYIGTVYEGLKQPLKAVEMYQKFLRLAPANNPNMAAVKERVKLLAPGRR
jgi:tetratricopeptide (TPR) repeat protein